jgi:cellulose synthase/poly-beta-1,6-N-acetylglucosamine synthase-like glycosyltransferase
LHSSPSPEERELFLDQNRFKLYLFGVFSTLALITGNIVFIKVFPVMWPFAIVVLITAFYLLISYLIAFFGKDFDSKHHDELFAKYIDRSESASVDIFLPVCKEPIEVIRNTWNHVRTIARVHENIQVHVLDDGKDSDIRDMAKNYGFRYITRENNELKKAGNLRNAFTKTSGEFILILDADFCPAPNFLIHTLPYMFEDESVAIVQTPQFFDVKNEYGWVRRGAGAVQELFYRLIQVSRNTFNGAICVGTNALYRRKHLEPMGGTAPMPYSEDVHTGFALISNGLKIKYVPINLALGMCPDTVKQLFTQQYRWALGSISLFMSKKFWAADITIKQRICYLSGMFFYISTGIGAVTAFIPGVFVLIFYPDHVHWYNLLFSVPSLIYTVFFMRWWMKLPFSVDVLRVRAVSCFAHLYALKDFIFNTLEEWKPTGAQFKSDRYNSFCVLFSFINIATTVVILSLVGIRIIEGHDAKDFILIVLFTLFNAFITLPIIEDL